MDVTRLSIMVKALLFDYADKKELNGYEAEFTTKDIINASSIALSMINNYGANKTSHTIETCPDDILILGTAKYLLFGAISNKASNQTAFKDATGNYVSREGNIEQYKMLYSMVSSEFEGKVNDYKIYLNVATALENL